MRNLLESNQSGGRKDQFRPCLVRAVCSAQALDRLWYDQNRTVAKSRCPEETKNWYPPNLPPLHMIEETRLINTAIHNNRHYHHLNHHHHHHQIIILLFRVA